MNTHAIIGLFDFLPEIFLSLLMICVLISGLYKDIAKASWWMASIGVFLCIVYLVKCNIYLISPGLIAGVLSNDFKAIVFKGVLLSFTLLILLFYGGMTRVKTWAHGYHEFVVIVLIASIGGMIAISARNFLILYISLELMALSSYVLAAYDRDQKFSTEAGMKYFILGSLSSCIFIFGMSYIYGFTGSLSYYVVGDLLASGQYSTGLLAGIFILLIALLFKLSIFPFHFWAPDIYQGSPFISVAFFASIPKFAVVCVLINIIQFVIGSIHNIWSSSFIFLAIISMIIGSLGAISQTSFKRLMGYSTVLNMGFVLLALGSGSNGQSAAILYQMIYSIASIGLFATLAISISPSASDYPIDSLAGFGKVKKLAAFSISVFMFSLVGIPPLAGFFAKFYVIEEIIRSGLYISAIITLMISVISAYYYINVVKVMYFMTPSDKQERLHESSMLVFVITVCTVITLLYPMIQQLL